MASEEIDDDVIADEQASEGQMVDDEQPAEAQASEEHAEEVSAADAPDLAKLKRIVEGAIFAAAKPMTIDHLGNLFGENERPAREDFKQVLAELTEEYAERGVMLKEVSSGFRFQVCEDVAPWVSRLWEEKPARYSRALLETLALIAYRQPITRGEIEEIRGVSTSSHIMKTLQERDWIRVVGHRDVPGRPAMYATTRQFLDYFNLKNIDELPSLAEIRDLDEINRELDLVSDPEPDSNADQDQVDETDMAEEVTPAEETEEAEVSAAQGEEPPTEGEEPEDSSYT